MLHQRQEINKFVHAVGTDCLTDNMTYSIRFSFRHALTNRKIKLKLQTLYDILTPLLGRQVLAARHHDDLYTGCDGWHALLTVPNVTGHQPVINVFNKRYRSNAGETLCLLSMAISVHSDD